MGYATRNVASTFGWFMQRITALFLAVGLLIHFWVLHFAIERPVTFEKVQERLLSGGWVFFDLLLLAAGLYHALNGVWNILTDYNPTPTLRKIYGWGLTVIGIGLLVYGYIALMPFTMNGGAL
jgi:succinate dehydrogenase / fumarate reductase, membrane anchor subunit